MYGGTKSEMERLLQDAEKLTGTKYDISNLSDVYSAIHVIQEEMGVTGTTAKEASETFTGSLSAMKAAAENVIGKLSIGEPIIEDVKALVQTASVFVFDNLVPMLVNIVSTIPTVIQTLVGEIANALIEFDWYAAADEMLSMLKTGIENVSSAFGDGGIIDGILNGVVEKLPSLLQAGVDFVTYIANGIFTNLPSLISTVGDLLASAIDFIIASAPSILSAGLQLIGNLAIGFLQSLPSINAALFSLIGNIVSSLIKGIPSILSAGRQMFTQLVNTIKSINWLSLGFDIMRGIANGIKNGVYAIVNALKSALQSAIDTAKNFLGINSPSRLFRDTVGVAIPEGVAVGINRKAKLVETATTNLAKTAQAKAVGVMSALGSVGSQNGFSIQSVRSGFDQTEQRPLVARFYLNSREMARATAEPMQEELDNNKKFQIMLNGGRVYA